LMPGSPPPRSGEDVDRRPRPACPSPATTPGCALAVALEEWRSDADRRKIVGRQRAPAWPCPACSLGCAMKTTLLFGPYSPPRLRRGQLAVCEARRDLVRVGPLSNGPIPWPTIEGRGRRGAGQLIVCGDLVRAVRKEAAAAIVRHWGVSQQTVWRWRKALGVGRMTPGTVEVYRRLLPQRIHAPEAKARAKIGSHSPELMARLSAARKGKPVSPQTAAAAAKAARRPRSKAHRKAIARGVRAAVRSGRFRPRSPTGAPWSQKELALLGQTLDRQVAAMTGRTVIAVRSMRHRLGIERSRHSRLSR